MNHHCVLLLHLSICFVQIKPLDMSTTAYWSIVNAARPTLSDHRCKGIPARNKWWYKITTNQMIFKNSFKIWISTIYLNVSHNKHWTTELFNVKYLTNNLGSLLFFFTNIRSIDPILTANDVSFNQMTMLVHDLPIITTQSTSELLEISFVILKTYKECATCGNSYDACKTSSLYLMRLLGRKTWYVYGNVWYTKTYTICTTVQTMIYM